MITDPEEDYAHGFVPFLGATVRLDSKPLIPRPETEYWTERAIIEMNNHSVNRMIVRVADVFAGSGAIGLAVLKHVPNAHVTFAEKEARHFPTIQKSLLENGIDLSRAILVQSDVWESVDGVFDFVLANPPYISRERSTVEESVTLHEPHEALFAGEDGFGLIRHFVEGLPAHLAENGAAWVEHEPFHSEKIAALAKANGLSHRTESDQYGAPRFTRLEFQNRPR